MRRLAILFGWDGFLPFVDDDNWIGFTSEKTLSHFNLTYPLCVPHRSSWRALFVGGFRFHFFFVHLFKIMLFLLFCRPFHSGYVLRYGN